MPPLPSPAGDERFDLRRRVLYRDDQVVVVDKPAGLPVHWGSKTTDHLELHLPDLVGPGEEPLRLAHRLDKDTSGCLVLARTAESAAAMGELFLRGRVSKSYWAVVVGGPRADQGEIDLPLMKVAIPGCSKVVATPLGKPALTRWRTLGAGGGFSLLELTPATGRMHQLRAHCALMGFPILGDPIYGAELPAPVALQLLARQISFPRGRSGPSGGTDVVTAVAQVPPHMRGAVAKLLDGWDRQAVPYR